ncbi:MAG: sulfotransferase family protein [Planctomycetia bacterium]|nr:sulfotransferase family protein [Planctomycetia bacterium]
MSDRLDPQRDFITIVSGLPRSGTSLMLQMLAAGGMPVLSDGVRPADDDNPHGYFEWEQVKSLKQDASWVPAAVGKAVKAIYWFLQDFPAGHTYRVIFLRRNLDEVLLSQAKMLERRGTRETSRDDRRMKLLFEQELREIDAWLAQQSAMTTLNVDYQAVLNAPAEQAARVDRFLGGGLNVAAMAAAVDPGLYRSRR